MSNLNETTIPDELKRKPVNLTPPYCVTVIEQNGDAQVSIKHRNVYRWQVDPQANLLLLTFSKRMLVLPMDGIVEWTIENEETPVAAVAN